jgi:MipA family protein
MYKAGNGLRDVSASLNLRTELDSHWLLLGGIGATRLLGPAADSPYTPKDGNWSASLGLAYRF